MLKKWLLLPATLMVMAGFFLTGCPDPVTPVKEKEVDATWTIAEKGGEEEKKDSTHIVITFSKAIAALRGQDIAVSGVAEASGVLVKLQDGKVWEVPIKVNSAGTTTLSITGIKGIKDDSQSVTVFKEGEITTADYSAVADGAANVTTSTKITLTFTEDVSNLLLTDITVTNITNGGSVEVGALSPTANAKVWELAITAQKQGNVTVKITRSGIDAGNKTVAVYVKAGQGISVPESGEDENWVWTKLTIVQGTGDDPAVGNGKIQGDDFKALDAAFKWQDTYFSLYYDLSNAGEFPGGAIGNLQNAQGQMDGSLNFSYSPNPSQVYTVITLKSIKSMINPGDDFLFINGWNGIYIAGVVLYVPKNPVAEEELADGYYEITLGTIDGVQGKGFLTSVDLAKVNAAGPNAYLEIHGIEGTGNWGSIMNSSWANKLTEPFSDGVAGTAFYKEVPIADIRTALEVETGAALPSFGFNPWSGSITKVYLVDPDAMDTDAPNPYTPMADGSARKSSEKITFTFVRDVDALAVTDIAVTKDTGEVTVGDLSPTTDPKKWELGITVIKEGLIKVKITKEGINADVKDVLVYFVPEIEVPADGQNDTVKWTNITVDTSVKEGDPESGKGNIAGADFDLIVEAMKYKGTFLRIYLDLGNVGSWPGGALGNLDNFEGGSNLKFDAPTTGNTVDLTLKDLKKYFDAEDDDFIYVNIWGGARIAGILLFEPLEQELESLLPDGVTEISLPNGDLPGKGEIGSIDVATINAAAPGSFLELYVLGSTQANEGWGIGGIGPTWDTPNVQIQSKGLGDFKVIVTLDALLALYDGSVANTIIINLYNCAGLEKIYLVQPVVTELTVPAGGDPPGKGNLVPGDVTKINAAKEGAFLKFYVTGSQYAGGIGSVSQYGDETARPPVSINTTGTGDQIATVLVADILAYFAITGVNDWLGINLWGCDSLTKIELVEP